MEPARPGMGSSPGPRLGGSSGTGLGDSSHPLRVQVLPGVRSAEPDVEPILPWVRRSPALTLPGPMAELAKHS